MAKQQHIQHASTQNETDAFRDRIATVDEKGKRKWVYAHKTRGKLFNIRTWVSWGFFILFFALPFFRYKGRPLFLFNIPEAKFILFGRVFWPQDFFIFGITMITGIVFIILFTAAFGRLFCGWVCPQTIFMEMLFRKIEFAIEGDAPAQKLLDKGPWNRDKVVKKTTKHFVFFLLSFIVSNFFLAYIIGMDELLKIIREPASQHIGGLSSIVIFSGVFYGVFSYFREQACTVICPYGRLQGVLLDRNSMIVAYDYKRGEPRGKFRKQKAAELAPVPGDCIDCFQCVKVCPTGIDIRNGTQMECVGCTSCIDACNKMMDATGREKGLIRYASENGIAEGKKLKFTGRMKFYTVLLVVLTSLLTALLVSRKDVDGTILRAGGMLYQERGADSVSNLYNIKIINKTVHDVSLSLKLENMPGSIIEAEGKDIIVKREGQGKGSFFIVLPRHIIETRKTKLKIGVYEGDHKITTLGTNFMGPAAR
ncbi:cytochrome c oxidase accessory protein CcoG [Agriterribacter sp.]|uniref:cytochrome c oxidase accessory protein CcoG n=1 Tax=Agriterribacter sp. TaxID=2821509 RepID=UPI002BB6C9E3|nr:cytochrome c oxidase accessory protein CcoG [Agriterribacter sp.]HTN06671.1 cytochrome c oxidase accessory protein CcoG [Agriterribacter sp.]